VWSSVKYPRIAYGVMTVALLSFYLFVSRQGSLDITGGVGAVARCLSGFFAGFIIHANRNLFDRMSTRALSALQIGSVAWIMISMIAPIADRYAVPAFVILVGSTWPDRGRVANALSTRFTDWLGERSYAVYISHVFIIELIRFVWLRTGQRWIPSPETARLLFLMLCFSIVLVVASVLYAHVERRIRNSMNRRLVRISPKVA
jgi:peptidoglycan/LPS O-acetylase OafA/YrhL